MTPVPKPATVPASVAYPVGPVIVSGTTITKDVGTVKK